jgi:hypothetical protein
VHSATGEHQVFDRERIQRAINLFRSRRQQYAGLRAIQSPADAVAWFSRNPVRLLNGNVLRAKVLQGLAQQARCDIFVETGTSHAATAIGVHRFLNIPVRSCETSLRDHILSRLLTIGIRGICLYKIDSRLFLRAVAPELVRQRQIPLFYLDAHEGVRDAQSLPLLQELDVILQFPTFVTVIDDFRVPGDDAFVFGTYGSKSITLSLVQDNLKNAGITTCYFPAYSAEEETGFPTGYCVLWRSAELDVAFSGGSFPFNLLKAHYL